MVGLPPTGGISVTARRLLERGVGGVVLMGTTGATPEIVRQTTSVMSEAFRVPPLITVDQEGGQVQRLTSPGFETIPSARQQAALGTQALRARATAWGRQLAAAGVNVDLAPVADVVPPENASTNEPVWLLGRGYGTDPASVTANVRAFAAGLREAGVGITLKHNPGLGRVVGNTDFTPAVDRQTTLDDPLLEPFRALAPDADMIMVATATYTQIDAQRRAAFSPIVMQSLRGMGFAGVIVSDDLGVAKAVADLTPGARAVQFLRAGGDLITSVDIDATAVMIDAVVAEANADPAFAQELTTHAARVLALKAKRGLLTCR